MLLRRIVTFPVFLFFLILFARGQEYPFVRYTPKDGLANGFVRDIYQDSKGRLFFSTFNGLSTYDGARFRNFTFEKDLPNPVVNHVIEVGPDSILVACNTTQLNAWVRGRMIKLNVKNCPIINKFFRATNGLIYVATDQGLHYLKSNQFVHLPIKDTAYKKNELAFDAIHQVGERLILKGIVDIESPGGLYLFNTKTNKLDTFITKPFHWTVHIPEKNVLMASIGSRVICYDVSAAANGKFIESAVPNIYKYLETTVCNSVIMDKAGNLWSSQLNTVTRVTPNGDRTVLDKTNGLDLENTTGVFLDKEGVLWIKTNGSGAIKLANDNVEFVTGLFRKSTPGISAINGSLLSDTTWLYNFHDHTIYGSSPKNIFSYKTDNAQIVHNVFPHPNGFYLLDDKGISTARFINRKKTSLHVERIYKDSLLLNYSRAITDGKGTVYVTGSYVLVYRPGKVKFLVPLPYYSDQLCIDSKQQVWTITRHGDLMCFTIHEDDPKNFLRLKHNFKTAIPHISPRSLAVDSTGAVWVGTRYTGLYRFTFEDTLLKSQSHITTQEGLSDNFIVHLNTSGKNTIWAGTLSGLDKISTKDGRLMIEGITRMNNVFEFVHSVSVSKDRKVWLRGASGSAIRINDDADRKTREFKPSLQITTAKTSDTSLFQPRDHYIFNYDQNTITFEAAAPTFIDEKQVLFSYLLEGSGNKKWSSPSPQSSFNFINLSPGKYELHVKAFFPIPEYESQELSYHFMISPPWWQTGWFKAIVVVVSILLLLLAIRAYVQRKLERQRMALEKQRAIEKERTRIASDMHDDLGAGLSTIRFLGEKINRTSSPSEHKPEIEKIVSNSNELVQKMNEIIWAMNEKNDSLEDLIFYTRSYAVEYCEENNLTCNVHLPETVPHIFVSGDVRRNIFLTVKESLHNVVKHAEASQVDINIRIKEGLEISITDNGTGMKKKDLPGHGHGLLSMRKRIQILGGTLRFTNGKGVTLELTVPIR